VVASPVHFWQSQQIFLLDGQGARGLDQGEGQVVDVDVRHGLGLRRRQTQRPLGVDDGVVDRLVGDARVAAARHNIRRSKSSP